MNLVYDEISSKLSEGIKKGYRGGLASMVKLNKKVILSLSESLFKISYNGNDEKLLKAFEDEAFKVAGVLTVELEDKLKAMAKNIIDGTHPFMKAHPESDVKQLWQDEAYNILADYIEVPDMPPPVYLNTNLRTAVTASYNAAQYQRLQNLTDVYTAYTYKTREDDRVREEHRALDNKIFAANDPIWNTIWPPNGWNCRCYVEPLSSEEAAQYNFSEKNIPEKIPVEDSSEKKALLKDANINSDFDNNAGKTKSIWGKWLNGKFKDKNLRDKVMRLVSNG